MNINMVETKIRNILDQYYDGSIDFGKGFEESGINSVTFVKIVVSVEREFDFQFYDTDFDDDRFKTIDDFAKYVYLRSTNQEDTDC